MYANTPTTTTPASSASDMKDAQSRLLPRCTSWTGGAERVFDLLDAPPDAELDTGLVF
jgi:hypothetical protein